jgi:hypothetical protein
MGLVDLYLEGVIFVGTIGGRGREGKDVVGTCVTKAACDPVGYVVAGGQDSTPTLRGESPQGKAADSDTQSPRASLDLASKVHAKTQSTPRVSIQEIHFAQRRQCAKEQSRALLQVSFGYLVGVRAPGEP